MVKLLNWKFVEDFANGICIGHKRLADGTYVHTSPVVRIEPCVEGLDIYTLSGTHYRCKTEEVDLDFLEQTKEKLLAHNIVIEFLDNAKELAEQAKKELVEDVQKRIGENDLYIELIGIFVKNAFFKKNGELIPIECCTHIGMIQDSYLLIVPEIVDVRYFDKIFGIDFYHVSDGVNEIYIKYIGELPFEVRGIGAGLKFTPNCTEVKKIKVEDCKEGLFSPDFVNGKSCFDSSNFKIGEITEEEIEEVKKLAREEFGCE